MRLRLPGVTPLELWDRPVAGAPLQAHRHTAGFGAALAEVVAEVLRASGSTAPVYVTGGAAGPGLLAALAARALPAILAHDPLFAAARAGFAWLEEGRGICLDVGQTGLKRVDAAGVRYVPRDLARVPLGDKVDGPARAAARLAAIEFIAAALRGAPGEVLVGLPCALSDEGVAEGCSYAWSTPDEQLVPAIAAAAERPCRTLKVLNDAELAALAARRDPRLASEGRVLVLTLGFGVGAAWLDRRS